MVNESKRSFDENWQKVDQRMREQIKTQISRFVRPCDRDDLMQEVLLTAWENRDRFQGNLIEGKDGGNRIGAWIHGITRFKLREYYEKSKRNKIPMSEYDQDVYKEISTNSFGPLDKLEANEFRDSLSAALAKCDTESLRVAILQLDGKNRKEIADILSWDLTKVYNTIARFNKKLAELRESVGKAQPQIVYSSKISLSEVFSDAIRSRAFERSAYGKKDAVANFRKLFEFVSYIDPVHIGCLVSAREEVEGLDVDISFDDRCFIVQEICSLTNEFLTGNPNKCTVVKTIKRIKFLSESVAMHLWILVDQID